MAQKRDKYADKDGFLREALERYDRAYERERENMEAAYEDLEFRAGEQWPEDVRRQRELEDRPCLTINRMPQFVRQVTNDVRMMRPGIKVVGVDDLADVDTAEILDGMIRYVENRSDAQAAYFNGLDAQVTCGIGHWQIVTEYASETTFDQEIRIVPIDDPVGVMWDPDSTLPTREDAMWCLQPVDMTHAAFKENYPDATVEEFRREYIPEGWYSEDYIRVARYWCKKPMKRQLALIPDGSIVDLTDESDEVKAQALLNGARVEERDGYRVYHSLITATQVLEDEQEWPGSYIPIVPCLGEEVRIGRRVHRHGVIRYAKDAQRTYNYFRSTQTEVVALQPKSPFIATEKNIEKYMDLWEQANKRTLPVLPFTPDQANNGMAPQRSQPPVGSTGLSEGVALASEDMKAVIGIYDAALGQRSNETSGVAIRQRQQESDVGTYTYIDNFARAVRYTGKILIDLIPKIYDTERTIRVLGDDGKVDTVKINETVIDPVTGEETTVHDLTMGSYDVVVKQGPSYTTRREEAKEGMMSFMQASPDVGAVLADLIAEAQDWPLADKIAKRLRTLLPPQIQQLEAEESGEPIPAPQPSPQEQMEAQAMQMQAQAEAQKLQMELQKQQIELREAELKLRESEIEAEEKAIELEIKRVELRRAMTQPVQQADANARI